MTEKKIASIIKSFDELTPHQLYDCLRLRSAIFVVEQNCVFLDMDNKDQECYHLMLYQDNVLVAYSRLVPVGGFATLDLSAGYTYKNLSLLASVTNITNTLNYLVHDNYSITPIPPREFLTTLTYKF